MTTKNDYLDIIEKTYELSLKLEDRQALDRINDISNTGKRVQMCVSTTLILDTFEAFREYRNLYKNAEGLKNSKVSLSLLTRYIFESYVNFLYIFRCKKGQTQMRSKAFYHYGSYKKEKMREGGHISDENEWKKYLPPKGSKANWHGKTFKEISSEVNYSPIVYQVLSQFTHPGIFTMERILETDMYKGIIEDSVLFTSATICDVMAYANNLKLFGLKITRDNEMLINDLARSHEELFMVAKVKKKANSEDGLPSVSNSH